MTHSFDAAWVVQTLSAFAYLALGAWVFTLRPRRRQTTLLGVFALAFGTIWATTDILVLLDVTTPASHLDMAIDAPFVLVAYGAALALAWSVPAPLRDRRLLWTALGVGSGLSVLALSRWLVGSSWSSVGFWLDIVAIGPRFGLLWAAIILLALRANPARGAGPAETTQAALLAVAFAMLDAFLGGMFIPRAAWYFAFGFHQQTLLIMAVPAAWVVVASFWAWNMVRAGRDTRRIHRAALLLILGLLAAGAFYQSAFAGVSFSNNIMRGVVRTFGVALLAYGILRHDLAGLDAKVRFGISKTTVAGIFIAVFFVVSEGAQELFAGFAGSEWLGIIAAGALLFAISPIQKLADRFAEKTVPGGAEAGHGVEDRYRDSVEMALADGAITEDEARRLAEKAEELEIPHTRAFEIRREVEEQASGSETA